ncbi:MAG: DUF362 domain-containing protein [Chloroflexi bacterium]|nr:DUF362 domain-containing protein [Chloroflexota bacterium]
MPADFPGKGRVAVLKTSPATVLDDYQKLMHLAGYQQALPADRVTGLKINISWQVFYPACSTTPWQLEGVIKTLLADGYQKDMVHTSNNNTVVVDGREGERNNKLKPVIDKFGLQSTNIGDPQTEWVEYRPKHPTLVLHKVFRDGIFIPKYLIGENVIHLPTMKTHVFTTTTGAMKNAFGGLLTEKRHWTHSVIHETLVDLLSIQREIHPGIFAVMDGTAAGEGPGPRAMKPHIKNYILASSDQVAIDAVAAKMMGFNPMKLDFISIAHQLGLGVGDPREITVVGEDISNVNWQFEGNKDTFASRGQKMIYHGPLKPFENLLLRTPLVPWAFFASNIYHNYYWYRYFGRRRVAEYMKSDWGKLFKSY